LLTYCGAAAVKRCDILLKVLSASYIFAIPPTAFLFFLRVRAMFRDNRLVTGFFGLLWLGIFGTAFIVPFGGVEGVHIGAVSQCIDSKVSQITIVPTTVNMAFDLLVFLSISWRLAVLNHQAGSRVQAFFTGRGMSHISNTLMQSGQLYFMFVTYSILSWAHLLIEHIYRATVGLNIVTVVMFLTPSIPAVVRAMITIPNIALENSMACRVFRMLKIDGNSLGSESTPQVYGARSRVPRPQDGAEPGHGMVLFRNNANAGVEVNVTRGIHIADDHSVKRPDLDVDVV
jgi:hypothetical protein